MNLFSTVYPLEEATRLAGETISLLATHSVPPSPLNFAVAFEYCAGSSAELKAMVDQHIAAGNALDAYFIQEVYERYFASEQFENLHGVGNDLQDILNQVVQNIAEAGEGASVYGETLASQISHLDSQRGPEGVQAIAKELLAATLDAQSRNTALQRRLEETRAETEGLRAELEQQRRAVLIDPLTGLYNRRAMDTRLHDLIALGGQGELSLLVLDIDHFKLINDTYGHAIGDIVIRNVASTLRKCIRGEDIAVRYGGEEFVVILPKTRLAGAVKVAETIRQRIETLRLIRRQDNFRLAPFTISIGVAECNEADTGETLFQRADRALYQSKSEGRNRVTDEAAVH